MELHIAQSFANVSRELPQPKIFAITMIGVWI